MIGEVRAAAGDRADDIEYASRLPKGVPAIGRSADGC